MAVETNPFTITVHCPLYNADPVVQLKCRETASSEGKMMNDIHLCFQCIKQCVHTLKHQYQITFGAQAFLVSLTGNEGILALCVSKAAGRSIIEKSAGPFTSHKVIRLHTAFPPQSPA